jgi:hypothetical protein
MCDPISIIGLGLSIGMAAANYSAQEEMANQQQSANDSWVAYQRRQSQEFQKRDEELRRNADAARTAATSELTVEKQNKAQENEQARLTTALTPEDIANAAKGDPNAIAGMMLSGQQHMADDVKGGIHSRIQQAAAEARDRLAALAAVQSYGGSQYGLTNRANTILNASGQDIRLAGNERAGQLAAYNVAKAVEPIKIAQHGGQALGALAGTGAQIAGGGLGTALARGIA